MSDGDYLSKTAEQLDATDELASFRSEFHLPIFEGVGADLVDPSLCTSVFGFAWNFLPETSCMMSTSLTLTPFRLDYVRSLRYLSHA